MTSKAIYKVLNYCIAAIWMINGLLCKVLNFVPRHRQIVAGILGKQYAQPLTILIGSAEMLMAIWILSNLRSRLNAVVQILIISVMNTLECMLVPDLLLWGKANAFFAFVLVLTIYFNEFTLNKRITQQA